jgi:predicted secreted hydrolase
VITHFYRSLFFFIVLSAVILFFADGFTAEEQDNAQWQQAIEPRAWVFPRDHGAHPEYRTEWWYFTGNLKDSSGNKYGYQLTFFRQGLRTDVSDSSNQWSIRDIHIAHFTITDIMEGKFTMDERMSRSGPGLAGALTANMAVWLFNWKAQMNGATIYLEAENRDMQLMLELKPRKPLVFHGDRGLSKKGSGKGQASYYTSFTDLETRGSIQTKAGGSLVSIQGISWFDHEFGSTQLSRDQEGWDWFGLHLSDGRDLMIYLLRKTDKTINQESSGTIIEPDGSFRHLKLSDFSVTILDTWKSPKSSGQYPCKWRIAIPSNQIDILISPLVPDQELDTRQSTGIIYWEGAVAGKGTSGGRAVQCEGYVELTGYAGSLGGIF